MEKTEMSNERVLEIARAAVEALAEDRGENAAFPFDAIWSYADEAVPPTLKSARGRDLIKEGYVELTGAMTRASSGSRAGSATREYRLGRKFRPTSQSTQAPRLHDAVDGIMNLESAMAAGGFVTTPAELANFYLALAAGPLVILTGISGTGKSKLPRLFAARTGSLFNSIPVKPQWSDNTDLFGYTPSLNPDHFITGAFTEVALEAGAHPDRLSVTLLDEMNLAMVEHYFSDFLSVIETRRRADNGDVVTDVLPLELPEKKDPDNFAHLRDLRLPRNVRIVGTANMDESTKPFSPKVLDRAFSIEFDDPDLTTFAVPGAVSFEDEKIKSLAARLLDKDNPVTADEAYAEASVLFDGIAGMLEEVKDILKPAGISFGYRTRNDFCLYMYFWWKFGLENVLSPTAAMDFCFLQKILPKIQGTGDALGEALENLRDWLKKDETGASPGDLSIEPWASRPWTRSADKVQRMINRLETESATTYWGT